MPNYLKDLEANYGLCGVCLVSEYFNFDILDNVHYICHLLSFDILLWCDYLL